MTNTDGINHTESGQIYFFHTILDNKTKFVTSREGEREPSSTQCQKAYFKIFIISKWLLFIKKNTPVNPTLKRGGAHIEKAFQG